MTFPNSCITVNGSTIDYTLLTNLEEKTTVVVDHLLEKYRVASIFELIDQQNNFSNFVNELKTMIVSGHEIRFNEKYTADLFNCFKHFYYDKNTAMIELLFSLRMSDNMIFIDSIFKECFDFLIENQNSCYCLLYPLKIMTIRALLKNNYSDEIIIETIKKFSFVEQRFHYRMFHPIAYFLIMADKYKRDVDSQIAIATEYNNHLLTECRSHMGNAPCANFMFNIKIVEWARCTMNWTITKNGRRKEQIQEPDYHCYQ